MFWIIERKIPNWLTLYSFLYEERSFAVHSWILSFHWIFIQPVIVTHWLICFPFLFRTNTLKTSKQRVICCSPQEAQSQRRLGLTAGEKMVKPVKFASTVLTLLVLTLLVLTQLLKFLPFVTSCLPPAPKKAKRRLKGPNASEKSRASQRPGGSLPPPPAQGPAGVLFFIRTVWQQWSRPPRLSWGLFLWRWTFQLLEGVEHLPFTGRISDS